MELIQATANPTVDGLVEAVTLKLQLPPSMEKQAGERAAGVKQWLNEPGTLLAEYSPEIHEQGSKRHGTTVHPKNSLEFDIDLVCLMQLLVPDDPITPHELYEMVFQRLHESPAYRPLLRRLNRCIRLEYANDFHLDILPARPDWRRGGTCVLVPDRQRQCWKPSNPKGFAAWFDEQATTGGRVLERYIGKAITATEQLQMKATLRRVVQLMKRRRDIMFDGDQTCARSIVLTTLAGTDYDGQLLCTDALVSVLDAIVDAFGGLNAPPPVPNPTNTDENFAEKWTRKSFAQFMGYVRVFRDEMAELMELHDLEEIHTRLKDMFGENVASEVVKELAERMREAKDRRSLRWIGPAVGLTTATSALAHPIPVNTFHGDAV